MYRNLATLTHNGNVIVRGEEPSHFSNGRTNGDNLFLGALVSFADDPDVILAQGDNLIDGVIVGQAYPFHVDLSKDHENPFLDSTWVRIYRGGGEAWCWIGGRYQIVPLERVIWRSYNAVESEFGTHEQHITREDYIIAQAQGQRDLIDALEGSYSAEYIQQPVINHPPFVYWEIENPMQEEGGIINQRTRVFQTAQAQGQRDLNLTTKRKILEFKISDLITLKLEGNQTAIYVKGKRFNQCKYLLLNLEVGRKYKEIESIDDAKEVLSTKMELNNGIIPPETEFWGHCSNLQVWVENEYNLNLIHTNLGFPLIRELIMYGDKKALIKFKEQIMERIEKTGIKAYRMFKGDIKTYFSKEELEPIYKYLEAYKHKMIFKLHKMPLKEFLKLDLSRYNEDEYYEQP